MNSVIDDRVSIEEKLRALYVQESNDLEEVALV